MSMPETEEQQQERDAEYGHPNKSRGWKHLRCVGDNLCAWCDGETELIPNDEE